MNPENGQKGRNKKEASSRLTLTIAVALVLASVVAVFALGFVGTAAAADAPTCGSVTYTGSGTGGDPWQVSNVDQLQCIDENHADATSRSDALSASYVLVSDVDASGTDTWNGGSGFDPIGDSTTPFMGMFDGAGYAVANLTIDRPSSSEVGLFGYVGTGGRVADLTVANATVTGGSSTGILAGVSTATVVGVDVSGSVEGDARVGGVVGKNIGGTVRDASAAGTVAGLGDVGGIVGIHRNGGTAENVTATVEAVEGGDRVGGLVGRQVGGAALRNGTAHGDVNGASTSNDVGGAVGYSEGTVENVAATGTVTGNNRVGGVIATSNSPYTVENVSATGNVTGDRSVGGAIGEVNSGTVADVSASGDVEGYEKVGGLVGNNRDTVRDGYATGSVTGDVYAGGLVGDNSGDVLRAYATGSVTGDGYAGGLVGENAGTVEEAYAVGSVTGNTNVGGLVGDSVGTVTAGYWNTETTGQSSSAGGTGLTTGEMLGDSAKTNMAGFDFTTYWTVVDNSTYVSYPYLRNNTQTPAPGLNAAPTTNAGGPYSVNEGGSVTLDGSGSTDPDGDSLSYEWDLNGDGTFEATGVTPTFDASAIDGTTSVNVNLEVEDNSGNTDTDSATVDVNNVAPTVTIDSLPSSANEGETVELSASFSDPGNDTHTATVDWGDGTTESVGVDQTNGTLSSSHTYTDGGTYTVNVTVTDDDGATGSAEEIVSVQADCINRRSVSRGQESQECPFDRTIERGESRDELDRNAGRNSDARRRDRSRGR